MNVLNSQKASTAFLSRSTGPLLVYLMTCYQWGLCFVSTNIMATPSSLVASVEAALVLYAAFAIMKSKIASSYLFIVSVILVYFASLTVLRGVINLQDARNVIIPLTFFFLGCGCADKASLDRLFWRLSCLVLLGVVLEYGLTEPYLRFFNIQHYYTDRGLVQGALEYINTSVLFNGERFSGRNILPFLGNQRISSVFLEPVSMGNFAIILAAWGLSFEKHDKRTGWKHLAMAAIFIIAADSRFGSLMLAGLVAVRWIPLLQSRYTRLALPFASVFILISSFLLFPEAGQQDDLLGRVVRSGRTLTEMSWMQWFGAGELDSLGDMGVAYTIEYMGVFMGLALAYFLTWHRFPKGQATILQSLAAYYATGILMISGTSFYSAKTAALLWFALGSLYALGAKTSPNEQKVRPQMLAGESAPAETFPHPVDRH